MAQYEGRWKTVKVEVADSIGWITLNRPEKRNAMSPTLNSEMREVLEAIVTHPEGVDPATLAEIQRYTKLFWINNGPYHDLTARKFVLTCTPDAFRAAAAASAKAGATFPVVPGGAFTVMRMVPVAVRTVSPGR